MKRFWPYRRSFLRYRTLSSFRPRSTRLLFERLEGRELLAGDLVISEFMASNGSTLLDNDAASPDWIEIHNRSSETVDLLGWSLTDDAREPEKWLFPQVEIEPDSYLVVFASAKDRAVAAEELHTNFKLSAGGETVALVSPAGAIVSAYGSDGSDYPEQLRDVSYGATPDGPRYLPVPTPGGPNGEGVLGLLDAVDFSVGRGFFEAPFQVELSSDLAENTIRFTTDGSLPTEDQGAEYAGPITIDGTTTLRAAAFRSEFLPSQVVTHTYLFLEDVLVQDPLNDPSAPRYPTVWQAGATADFAMDPEIIARWNDENPESDDFGIREALLSLPTMSIVLDHEDLWNATTGIYPNATSRGKPWRRPASFEYFDPKTGEQFQFNGGVAMHGNASRDNVRLKKHSFRMLFNDDFPGPDALPYPLFKGSPVDNINTVVLRAWFTDAFATRTANGRYSPFDSQYTRDVWMRDTQLAMGSLSARSTYVHLYINGLYWGMYSPAERPDDAFLSDHLGGEGEDWDIVKDFNDLYRGTKAIWNDMFTLTNELPEAMDPDAIYQQLQGNNRDGTGNPDLPNYLDMDNFIDYMVLHLYAGAEDWPHHNWYAARNRVEPGKGFQFFVWDQEIVLDGRFRDRTNIGTIGEHQFTPAELYDKLQRSSEFRQRFADRVQKQMFNGGALTTQANIDRWMARSDEVEAAIIAESARWGDARAGERVHVGSGQPFVFVPTMTVDLWRAARDDVVSYFPISHQLTIERFRAIGLFPSIAAPEFNQHGGTIPQDFDLRLSAPQGAIYYTTDGSDPRLMSNVISGFAADGLSIENDARPLVSGNEILKVSLDECRTAGLNASIYTHPIGFHGHAAGVTIGMWDRQDGVPGKGDCTL
ncbi:MAG: chitobiase/beta-hexosaminidase C-terminal domain-containing protein, partial [Pirellulales bacterium]